MSNEPAEHSNTGNPGAEQHTKEAGLSDKAVSFIKTNLDEIMIIGSFVAIRDGYDLTETDGAVLAAFQRYSGETQDIESIRDYLGQLSDAQIGGVVSNVKGILHEMEYVRIENADGDSVTAALFPDTNHEGFDVLITDGLTGEIQEIQLKATDSTDYVQVWLTEHSEGEIQVTQEIADELNLASSGFSNEQLTVRTEDFVDGLLSRGAGAPIWTLLPALSLISISFVAMKLYERFAAGEITKEQLYLMLVKASGIKIAKISILMVVLSIPVLNVVVGAALVAKIIYSLVSLLKPPEELGKSEYLNPVGR